ncbi:hypothetical protein V1514DRAFT_164660 [Lipomyces japonicus]|uniref:uncharacterized protein n=1 Tax=Lipomyces japonicus TaxID=56871 RepID=UPI0034CFFCE9
MSGNLDKSLDEIISSGNTRRRGRGPAPRGGRPANGGVRKAAPTKPRKARPAAPAPRQPAASNGLRLEENDKIIISNLPLDVQETAIKEYFQIEIGPVKRCTLNYDSKGQSTGVVTINFTKPGDAHRAWKKFNGTTIDGDKTMHVELVFDPNKRSLADRIQGKKAAPAASKARKGGAPPPKPAAAAGGARGGRTARGGRGSGSGGGARGGRPRRPKKTVEQLDADMADYFVKDNVSVAAPVSAPAVDAGDIPM